MKHRKFSFTLVEVIVSMAVFAILMLGLMQFFSSAQGLWTSTSNQVSTYEEARTAMNMIATDLMCAYYEEGRTVGGNQDHRYFFIVQDPAKTFKPELNVRRFKGLAFATLRSSRAHADAITRLTEVFYRKRGNHLEMKELADNEQDKNPRQYYWVTDVRTEVFPSVDAAEFPLKALVDDIAAGSIELPDDKDDANTDSKAAAGWSVIAKNVVRFSVKVYRPHGGAMQFSEMFNATASSVTKMPDMVVLRLLMIDPQTAKEIKILDEHCIYEEHLETQVSRNGLLYDSDEVLADGSNVTDNRIRELLRKNMVVVTRAVTLNHEF